MGDWRNAALQAAFWTYANSLRVEAKLCDIVLYVQGRKGAMVGYPAHKLLLISASKYFKLLFEREDLRNFCHFPHLSEDGLFTVLDIVYGREIADSVNLDDALMAARFLQVDCAVEELEAKRTALEAKARAPPSPKPKKTVSGIKRRATSPSGNVEGPPSSRERLRNESSSHNESAEMRIFKNFRNQGDDESVSQSFHDSVGSPISHEENSSTGPTDGGGGEEYEQQDNRIKVKSEPNVDLTMEEEMGYSQGEMTDQGYGQMDNMNTESGLGMFGSGVSFETDGAATFGDQAMYEGGTYMMGSDNSMDKKRQCDICGKVFATAKHLEDHRATHTGRLLIIYHFIDILRVTSFSNKICDRLIQDYVIMNDLAYEQ